MSTENELKGQQALPVSVCVCVCVCVWLIGGSIWGSISHSNCLAKLCNCALSHHKLCLTPCATPNPLPTLHIIQLDKFPFFLTVLPACIPLFILLNFCPTPTELLSKSFSRPLSQISMSGYSGWNRGSLTDSSVGVVVSVPAPSLEQGCLPEESAHGNTNSPNNDASSTLPEFIDAIDSVRDHESILR